MFKNSIVYSVIIFLSFYLIQYFIEYYSYQLFYNIGLEVDRIVYYSRFSSFLVLGSILYVYFIKNDKFKIEKNSLNIKMLFLMFLISFLLIFIIRFTFKFLNNFENLTFNSIVNDFQLGI